MSGTKPTERKFEEYIQQRLLAAGYTTTPASEYDRNLCLIRKQLINFIKATQPEKWERLSTIYDGDTENKVLARIASEAGKRGIIDVLRKGIKDRGVYLDLYFPQPKSDMNPDHAALYDKNELTIVRQLRYSTRNENSIDAVVFINGLPVLTMELKNQLTGQNIKHSEYQYKNDRDPSEPLLKFKRCVVHFCVDNDKVSMATRLAGKDTVFLPYNRDIENPVGDDDYRTSYLWDKILAPSSLLDILENYVHVAEEKEFYFNPQTQAIAEKKKEILIFPRFHQLDLIRRFRDSLQADGVGTNYLVQHTTGSGKSYSIGWLAHMLTSLYQKQGDTKRLFDTIVVVTDRVVLDNQLRRTVKSLQQTEGVVSAVESGSSDLKKFLEQGKDIVITTIQKFPHISNTIAALGNRTFAVIIDEVHSSQSGELSRELRNALSKTHTTDELDEEVFDYEAMMEREIASRGRQNHISFFGFTGTPKSKTLELFGTKTPEGRFIPFHVYSMRQSIHEGFTLDVLENYTTYKRYFTIKQTAEKDTKIPTRKGKREMMRYVDGHKQTIQSKVGIMLDHWVAKGSKEIKGQARGMVVTSSRQHCVRYFHEINRQLKERGLSYRCLVAFSGEVSDRGEKYTEAECNRSVDHNGDIPLGLKTPQFRLLVVANKFQTGFDEPLVQSMYIDKKLDGVHCVQTLSRLNRTASGKTQTFVLDFVNEPEDISESFQQYYEHTILSGETDPNLLYDYKREIDDFHLFTAEDVNRFCEIFYNPNRDEGHLHPILDRAVQRFCQIEDADQKEQFRSKIQSYIRLYGYLSQIIDFTDIELEKNFVFLRYLNRKLPPRPTDNVDIRDAIDLESLRLQKIHEQMKPLEPEASIIDPPGSEVPAVEEPEYDYLSEIISEVNHKYGANLTEEDKLDLSRLNKRMMEDSEIKKFMNANNTDDNKRMQFNERLEEAIIDHMEERLDFYKKMDNNPEMKKHIFRMMYQLYKQQSTPHHPTDRRP